MLRNVLPLPYLIFYAFAAGYVVLNSAYRVVGQRVSTQWLRIIVFVWAVLHGFLVSLVAISASGALYGLARIVFAWPVVCALYLTDSLEDSRVHVRTMVLFFAAATLTLPLQLIVGQIQWFASSTERAGLGRFSSRTGSLTSVGIVVGCYLALTQALKFREQVLFSSVIGASILLSMSKAAMANFAVAFLLLMFMNRSQISEGLGVSPSLGVAGVLTYAWVTPVRERIDVLLVSFGVDNASVANYDRTVLQSVNDRLVALLLENLRALDARGGPLSLLTGGGFGMADTALVPESDSLAPVAHNFSPVFRLLMGIAQSVAMIVTYLRLGRIEIRNPDPIWRALRWAFGLYLLNAVFANGVLYQPSAASILMMALYVGTFRTVPFGNRSLAPLESRAIPQRATPLVTMEQS